MVAANYKGLDKSNHSRTISAVRSWLALGHHTTCSLCVGFFRYFHEICPHRYWRDTLYYLFVCCDRTLDAFCVFASRYDRLVSSKYGFGVKNIFSARNITYIRNVCPAYGFWYCYIIADIPDALLPCPGKPN